MTMAKILAPLTGSPSDKLVLCVAFLLARSQNTYVDTMFVFPDPRETVPVTEMPMTPEIYQQIVDAAEEARKHASKSARESFSVVAAAQNIKIVSTPERSVGNIATYRESLGHLRDVLRNAALFADVVILPPLDSDSSLDLHDVLVDVLVKSRRPVILCPQRAPATLGHAVLVGWDGGAAAAQALSAAMPILEKAEKVQLACIWPKENLGRSLTEAKQYLALHGIDARETRIPAPVQPTAIELLDAARKINCDLLVIGGYGHSRTLETLFGGTTDTLLSHADIPLFLAH